MAKITATKVTPVEAAPITATKVTPVEAAPITAPFSLSAFYPILQSMSESTFVIDDYNRAFAKVTAKAVQDGSLSKGVKLLLDMGFNRLFSVHTACVPSLSDIAEKTARIRLVETYWSVGVATKTDYKALFAAPKAPAGRGRGAVESAVDYTPLISELQLLHDSGTYNEAESETIRVIIDGLTITDTNTLTETKSFFKLLTTDKDFADEQVYIALAITAATTKAADAATKAAAATQTAEEIMKAKIMARLKR